MSDSKHDELNVQLDEVDSEKIRNEKDEFGSAQLQVPASRKSLESKDAADTLVNEKTGDNEKSGDDEDEIVYPAGLQLALITLGLVLVIFVVALDNTIIATAIPTITTVFDSLDDVGWYGSSYLLTTTALQPSFGKIYTYFSVKWTYLLSLVLFEIGSIICAAATSSPMLIVGRAVAGAGASALFSGAMTIIGFAVPIRQRPIYLAIISSMFGVASVVGPLLGGVLTDRVSWRWCFWINLPFGGAAFLCVLLFFKAPKRSRLNQLTVKERLMKIDFVGAFFLITAIVCLLLALQWGGTTYPWGNSKVWGTILGFGLLITIFIGTQIYIGDEATIPLRLIKRRTVGIGALYTAFFCMALFTHIYYIPFYFQAVKGTTAEASGIRSIPYVLSNSIGALLVGGLITKIGYYVPFMWIGGVILTIGSGTIFLLDVSSNAGRWIGYQIIAGFGSGIGMQVPFLAVQASLNPEDLPVGNAIMVFSNSLGGAIAISIAQNIFSNTLVKTVPRFAPNVDPHVILANGATKLRDVVPADQLQAVLKAYAYALDRAFILPIAVGAAAFVASLFMEWGTVKGKDIKAASVA